MFSRNAKWRRPIRRWFSRHKTAQSIFMMLKSQEFYRELWNFPKLYKLTRVFPYTLVAYSGLSGLYDLAQELNQENVAGAFVECGVWRGGCAAILATCAEPKQRHIHLFDSFAGMPTPLPIDGKRALKISEGKNSGELNPIGYVAVGLEAVENTLFEHFGFNRQFVHLHKGWFQDTLPQASSEIGAIALLRLDGDWYESTKTCFENLYDNVVVGGYIVIDDYQEFDGCRIATDEFLAKRGLSVELRHFANFGGSYFRKPA